jgi:uncharacterized protein (UPF0261 family)
MNSRTIAVICALDTKGAEAAFLRETIEARGHAVLLIDVGVLGVAATPADVMRDVVAEAGGAKIADLQKQGDKAHAMDVMTRGAAQVAGNLYGERKFQAILGIGGSAGTAIATSAMRAVPIGVPKVMVSTVAAGDTRPYVGTKDITMMYSIVDIAGINRISSKILSNAAGAAIGMAETEIAYHSAKPLIAASMFGNTTPCIDRAREQLNGAGYEVLVFHATGVGGATMESLVQDRLLDGLLDLTTTEWADELCGGVFSAGPHRLEAAALSGTPQIVAPGCLDMVNFAAPPTVPTRYADRKLYRWNANVTLMRTNVEENEQLGKIIAEKLNRAIGPLKMLIPLQGISQLDSVGKEFWWPEADEALFRSLRANLRADIPVIDVDANINDRIFADTAVAHLRELIEGTARPRPSSIT